MGLKKEILKTIRYFSFFDYPPTVEEIYTFLTKKYSKKKLKKTILTLEHQSKIISYYGEETGQLLSDRKKVVKRYAVGGDGIEKSKSKNQKSKIENQKSKIKNQKAKSKKQNDNLKFKIKKQINNFQKRYLISKKKLNNWRFRFYIKLLSFFPQIKLVGLSGSIAMMNAKEEDDIDLFIITAKNRLWTGRFIALLLAQLLGIRRKRFTQNQRPYKIGKWGIKDKVCLNLFFDESSLQVPEFKKTEYVAHEILQMKPLVIKDDIYQRFLKANNWVLEIFPNANSKFKCQSSNVKLSPKPKYLKFRFWILNFICHLSFIIWIFDRGEDLLKRFQLYFINRHRTTEVITNHQLWFHPEDFGKKIRQFFVIN